MEIIYKIRRKADGKFYESKHEWGDSARARIFKSSYDLVSFMKSNRQFQDDFKGVEVLSFSVKPQDTTEVQEWFDANSFFLEQKNEDLQKKGRFLYYIMKANLRKEITDSSLILSNEDGWFLISEISQNTKMPQRVIIDISQYFKVHYENRLIQAFWVNPDNTKICFSYTCENALGIKQDYEEPKVERELEKFMKIEEHKTPTIKDENRIKQLTPAR